MTEDQINTVASMWRDNIKVQVIADALGVSYYSVRRIIQSNRERFPYRNILRLSGRSVHLASVQEDRVKWRTEAGALVTLPRVRILEQGA